MLENIISLYQGVKDTTGTTMPVKSMLSWIKKGTGSLDEKIKNLRDIPEKKQRDKRKILLPAVTWSGTFSARKKELLTQHSGIICIDLDDIDIAIADKLKTDVHLFAMFVSPSGNGLKLLFKIDMEGTIVADAILVHESYFRVIADYLGRTYHIKADESGKDVSRLCFLSYDKDIFINENATVFTDKIFTDKTEAQPKATATAALPQPQSDIDKIVTWARNYTDKKGTYTEKNYNNYVYQFCCNLNRKGIAHNDAVNICYQQFPDYPATDEKGMKASVESAYKHHAHEHGKWANSSFNNTVSSVKSKRVSKHVNTDDYTPKYNEDILFWYTTEKPDKETGEMKVEHKFDHDGLTFFMFNNGFRKLKLGEKGYQFVRLSGNLIEAVEPDELNSFISEYLHQYVSTNDAGVYDANGVNDDLKEVRKMYKRGINNYTKNTNYQSLMPMHPKFLNDDEKTSYLYFENCYVKITAEGKEVLSYDNLKANIWSKQRKQHTFALLDGAEIDKCVANQFIQSCVVGEGSGDEEKDRQKIKAILTTIGYLLDGFKDPTNTKAPVFQDRKINTTSNDANGGSGKSLTAKIISKMISTCMIDGKVFSFDSPYPYDLFQADHKLIVYNDVNKKFPFERLFHKITEDFQYDKRYVDAILIPFEDSPKHLIITNYSLTGDGSSFRRRQQIIEFTDFFNDEYTPKDHFGHRFFTDWDDAEWNRFYNFAAHCLQMYKLHGLVAFPAENVMFNKLIQTCGESFVDWMETCFIGDDKNSPFFLAGARLERDLLFTKMKDECKQYSKMENSNTFSNWVKLWCNTMGFDLNAHKNGGKDKSGNTYYWTFTKKK